MRIGDEDFVADGVHQRTKPVQQAGLPPGFEQRHHQAGELLEPLALPPAWYLLLLPPVQVPTAAVFAAPELTRDSKPIKMLAFFKGLEQRTLRNDLQPVVSNRYPEVAHHLAWLRQHGEARMSGSGACVFAEFSTETAARAVHAQLPQTMRGLVVRGLERHPLQELSE
ncbi:MAG TPA: hypothetical protein VKP68_05005 [Ramlibacter sp.]|nr:hypothetical protein [Ramlibacter sp.]